MLPKVIIDYGEEIATVATFKKHFGFPPLPKKWIAKPRKLTLRDYDLMRTFLYHRITYRATEDLQTFDVLTMEGCMIHSLN